MQHNTTVLWYCFMLLYVYFAYIAFARHGIPLTYQLTYVFWLKIYTICNFDVRAHALVIIYSFLVRPRLALES
jgi:hypothetical protein